jgi:hypothetical protein
MHRHLHRPALGTALVALALAVPLPGRSLAAQAAAGDDPVSILVGAARAEYTRDAFCLDPLGWLSTFRFSAAKGAFALSAAYVGAYPWPVPPPPLPGTAFIDRGPAYQIGLEVDPLRVLGGGAETGVGRLFTPFVGGGVHLSTDGEAALAGVNGPEPTVAIQGGADPFVSYGARLTIPLGGGGVGLFGEVRGTSVFDGGKTFVALDRERLESESSTLTWAEFSAGIRLRLR